MRQSRRDVDRLARCIMIAAAVIIVGFLCWFFRDIIAYILVAVVVSLIANPIVKLLKKIHIKGRYIPGWMSAALALIIVIGLLLAIIFLVVPIVSGIVKNISVTNIESSAKSIAVPLADFNAFLRDSFSSLGPDFRIEVAIIQELQKLFDTSRISSIIGSAASFITSFGVGIFSVVFISFFFIKDDSLFTKILCALVPDKHEKTVEKAISDIEYLLSRYFVGVLVQVMGVALVNFLGLFFIARLGFHSSIGIAFLTGIFNIIPYIGPLLGGALGTIFGLVLKYTSVAPVGLDVSFWFFTAVLIAIFCFTQFMDNYLYQPLIYSTSIKAKPLEVFFVMLIVGYVGGPLAMIIAIPIYTVFRVIAFRFFGHIKAIRKLIPSEDLISND